MQNNKYSLSHPARGAWIETIIERLGTLRIKGRTPPGVRGLKLSSLLRYSAICCRTPPGVRGLKPLQCQMITSPCESHPARGAWIETIAQ